MNNHFGFVDIILLAMFAGFIILRQRNKKPANIANKIISTKPK